MVECLDCFIEYGYNNNNSEIIDYIFNSGEIMSIINEFYDKNKSDLTLCKEDSLLISVASFINKDPNYL